MAKTTHDCAFDPRAHRDLVEARKWYREISIPISEQFVAAVEEAVLFIRRRPQSGRPIKGNIRRHNVRGFPYHLYYETIQDRVLILGVFHVRRNAESWSEGSES